jgi:hypothetical protein
VLVVMAGTSAANTVPPGPISFQITPTPRHNPENPSLPARISLERLSHDTTRAFLFQIGALQPPPLPSGGRAQSPPPQPALPGRRGRGAAGVGNVAAILGLVRGRVGGGGRGGGGTELSGWGRAACGGLDRAAGGGRRDGCWVQKI